MLVCYLIQSSHSVQFGAEAKAWRNEFDLEKGCKIAVPGLTIEYPDVAYNSNGKVCLITTGMGRKILHQIPKT
jgi:purine nucleoside permease